MKDDLQQQVIQLHDIARVVEKQVGVGKLSKVIREIADQLSDHTKPSQ